MPEPVGLDTTELSGLTDRLARAADELSAVPIPDVAGLPGSALSDLDAPRLATADVRRLGQTIHTWVAATRRCADELMAADGAGADHLRAR